METMETFYIWTIIILILFFSFIVKYLISKKYTMAKVIAMTYYYNAYGDNEYYIDCLYETIHYNTRTYITKTKRITVSKDIFDFYKKGDNIVIYI